MNKINLKLINKPIYKVLNGIAFASMIAILVYIIINWRFIPSQIPSHYNALGNADAWSGKKSILMLPIIGMILYVGITILEQFPSLWNTGGIELTEKNQYRILTALKGLVVMTKFSIMISFSYITICGLNSKNLGNWFIPVFLMLIFGPMAYYLIKMYKTPKNEK